MGFSTGGLSKTFYLRKRSRNPFQGGVGFSTPAPVAGYAPRYLGRNPFQGGVGFSTAFGIKWLKEHKNQSQSLSGWGGVGFSTRLFGCGW